ncbi:MAG: MFS transporter [Verrucomicrobia bacterium]|nr:MFS transporter [Verrucomicrobiota bacterium]
MVNDTATTESAKAALDRARQKAYWRLLPLLFICYVVAYVDRSNVAIAKLTMTRDLPGFDNAVIGFGAGVFFAGYFLLEIPGTLIVENWSARKWICRIMITWGITAALTAVVKTPFQFYLVRFFLGLAEAGFFPGVIVYLTHWFPSRDRARALAYFFVATPIAQIISPKISNVLLKIGTDEMINGVPVHHPELWGLEGWQWIYICWGIPAVLLGVFVFFALTDRPRQAKWLSPEERDALEAELQREKAIHHAGCRLTLLEALRHPKVLLLAAAYFCIVTGSYGVEFFMPSILEKWYSLKFDALTWLVTLPPLLALFSQLFVGWNSDRARERCLHVVVPITLGAVALALTPLTHGYLFLTVACFMVAVAGFKAYLPAFWSLPSLFLTEAAAAGSIGLINSIGNLGGFLGPYVIGKVETVTGSFVGGIYFLSSAMVVSAAIIFCLKLGRKAVRE